MEWMLYRHKAGRKTPSGAGFVESSEAAAIYWARISGEKVWVRDENGGGHREGAVEIRTPVNAAGNGSEDPGEMYPPERSARSGLMPAAAFTELYDPTTPEALGLTVI